MNMAATQGIEEQLRLAKRKVAALAVAQAIQGSVAPVSISLGGLAGYQLLADDKSFATLPVTGFNLGTACGAALIAILSRMIGRKYSFMAGAVLGGCGGTLAAIALMRQSFWLFALALMLIGIASGFNQKIRFAAADVSPSFYKPKAISWILVGGIVSAVLGPQIAIWLKDALPTVPFAGAYMALIPLCAIVFVLFAFLQLPDMRKHEPGTAAPRPLSEIVKTQRFVTGMICGISTYALMTFMMTGAPLAMVYGCGISTELSTLGIQWHVLAMFGPSFFTGMLIIRFGAEKVVAMGLVILMGCALVAHAGIALWNFWGALILLGVGWNFGFIGATSIVASSYRPEEADKVQGFHDIVLFGFVAMSSFLSGKVYFAFGWSVMTFVIWPVTGLCLILLALQVRKAARRTI
ncbi:MFS transporter [Rhizobium sp. NRK18]|uniref:MFS transporter n=1 Tax=Rhizobium sp. NRK18 TaxID=2964667 RepID=UPI0021C45422|nr:MFS transporter [Rhizobium sp. NRK18]MCQ2004646.1 MFS transporter [Rhizobium sp. NRK18]